MDELDRVAAEFDELDQVGNEFDQLQKKGTGFKGVGEDILQGISDVPGALYNFATELPGELYGVGKQAITDPSRLGRNLAAGLAKGGHGTLSSAGNIRDYLAKKGLISEQAPSFRLPEAVLPREYNYAQGLGVEGQQQGDILAQGLGMAPHLAGGELGALGGIARTGARSAALGQQAIGQNENPITAALMVPGIELPLKAASKIGGMAMTPSGYIAKNYSSPLSAQQLSENLRAASGTNTPLGDVISSPRLKQRFENEIAPVIGSKADELYGQIENQVRGKGERALRNLETPGARNTDVNFLTESLLKAEKGKSKDIKNRLYGDLSRIAQEEGFQAKTPTFSALAKKNTGIIEDSELLKHNDQFRAAYKKMAPLKKTFSSKNSAILNKEGRPAATYHKYPTISEVKIVANQLSKEGEKMLRSNDPTKEHLGRKYQELARAARDDIKNGIERNGSERLKQSLENADKFYREDYARFRQEDIHNLIGKGKSGQKIIKDIIQPGKETDIFETAKRVKDILPANQKDLLGYGYLKGAINKKGELNPRALNKRIENLGNRQFNELYGRDMTRQELLDFQNLVRMNSEALNRMHNPKTGARSKDKRSLFPKLISVGTLGSSKLVEPLVANAMVDLLTSEKFRGKVVEKMVKNQARPARNTKSGSAKRAAVYSSANALGKEPFLSTENYDVY